MKYIAKKLLDLIPTLLGISLVCFFLIRLIPGDPVLNLIGERGADPARYLEMKKALGLDLPITEQFWIYLKSIFRGDIGTSIISNNSVWNEFIERFPATLELGIVALIGATVIGIPVGIFAAMKRNSFFDYFLMSSSLVGYSMPIFWWGLILILLFSVKMGITPVSGRIDFIYDIPVFSGLYLIDTLRPEVFSQEGFGPFLSALKHLILPSIALGTIPLAVIARMTRSSMLEVLGEDYIRTAKAKGMSKKRIIYIHALRNALVPIITTLALLFGSIITGAILTETIFSWPGIGKWIVASITARDYPVIQGGVLIISFVIVLTNIIVDIIYYLLNPKMRS
ncbi:dipeptide ABC transporter permease DppB [Bacteriovorax stolpii]|uniref:ABC transporter permease n=1 Tax=Bacteriovorax stolpii TaxID=960 RepID=UPI0011572A10|nr:ABC transporter permease subunit [Bacteriovorax stolpii]QDK41829.1 dipeptide ABC transporter permease DppB [Bacteriovorax stolpii]